MSAAGDFESESLPLLVDSESGGAIVPPSENSSSSRVYRVMITASLLAAMIVMGGMALYHSPLDFADSLAAEFTHFAASGMFQYTSTYVNTRH